MDGSVSVSELAGRLRKAFPGQFISNAEALKYVRDLAQRYS